MVLSNSSLAQLRIQNRQAALHSAYYADCQESLYFSNIRAKISGNWGVLVTCHKNTKEEPEITQRVSEKQIKYKNIHFAFRVI